MSKIAYAAVGSNVIVAGLMILIAALLPVSGLSFV